jgi:hypothetical protein
VHLLPLKGLKAALADLTKTLAAQGGSGAEVDGALQVSVSIYLLLCVTVSASSTAAICCGSSA